MQKLNAGCGIVAATYDRNSLMGRYRIIPHEYLPGHWVLERVAVHDGAAEPLMVFSCKEEASDALAWVDGRQTFTKPRKADLPAAKRF